MRPIDILFGGMREQARTNDRCMPAPIGCGGPAEEFTDEASRREYGISRFCQKCQDSIFHDD
jgi:hypothetical protein